MNADDINQIMDDCKNPVSLGDLVERVTSTNRAKWRDLPKEPGVYAVCLEGWGNAIFSTDAGMAIYAKPCDPEVLYDKRNRILASGKTDILYIGKGRNLCKWVQQLARFGAGKARNHKGGEWLWQIDMIKETSLRTWCCSEDECKHLKQRLLDKFYECHGDLPLANRSKP